MFALSAAPRDEIVGVPAMITSKYSAGWLPGPRDDKPARLCYTTGRRRSCHPERSAVGAKSKDRLTGCLRAIRSHEPPVGSSLWGCFGVAHFVFQGGSS